MFRILALLSLPMICLGQGSLNGERPTGELLSNEISPNELKRNASFNLEEIKVRWKKAALENCTGVPCVTAPTFTCGTSTITDIDNNSYPTVLIGTQCWTQTNLKVTKYNDGTLIGDSTNSTWGTAVIGARTEYVGVTGYVGTFGYLYNWYAATDSRKLCPSGWHVPTDAEWTIMIQALDPSQAVNSGNVLTFEGIQSTTAGTLMKSVVTNPSPGIGLGWNPGSPGTNTSGFSALPGGYRVGDVAFGLFSDGTFFWSATENGNFAFTRGLFSNIGVVERYITANKSFGESVRCLRD